MAGSQSFLFAGSGEDDFPGSLRPILYARTGGICLFLLPSLTSTQPKGHIPQVDNGTCREHDVSTLPPISLSAGNTVHVRQADLRCTAVATVVVFIGACGPSSTIYTSMSAAAVCDRSTLAVYGNVRIVWIKYQCTSTVLIFPMFGVSSPKLTPEIY